MAVITVFDPSFNVDVGDDFDLNWYLENAIDSDIEFGTNESFNGYTYPDNAFIEAVDTNGDIYELVVGGYDITTDGEVITGGRITGLLESINGTVVYAIQGIDIAAVDLQAALSTETGDDDLALLVSVLQGADTIRLSQGDDTVFSFGGNDLVYGFGGNNTIDGGAGDDRIFTGGGNDLLFGGDGNDQFFTGGGSDYVDGGAGIDFVATDLRPGFAVVSGDGANVIVEDGDFRLLTAIGVESLGLGAYGTVFEQYADAWDSPVPVVFFDGVASDSFVGSQFGDTFLSASAPGLSGGFDYLYGGGGNDHYNFTGAAQSLNNTFIGDFAVGDWINLNGNFQQSPSVQFLLNTFIGSAEFSGTAGEYRYDNVNGTTIVQFDSNGDGVAEGTLTLDGGEFALEQFTTAAGEHNLRILVNEFEGTEGPDNLVGTTGADIIRGLGGNDLIDGLGGEDDIDAGTGDDTIILDNIGWQPNGSIDGGDGNDTLEVSGDAEFGGTLTSIENIHLVPTTNEFGEGTELTMYLANLQGSPADLTVSGTGRIGFDVEAGASFDFSGVQFAPGSDVGFEFEGDDGSDVHATWIGTSGNDHFDVEGGNVTITGGAGADSIEVEVDGDTDSLVVITDFTRGQDRLSMVDTNFISFSALQDVAVQDGNDTVITLSEDGGSVTIRLQNVVLSELTADDFILDDEIDNFIFGGDGDDDLAGYEGNDTIYGGNGNDRLDGGIGNDLLFGEGGNDELIGGAGTDFLVGGAGDDILRGGDGGDSLQGGFFVNPETGNFGFTPSDRFAGNDQFFGGAGLDGVAFFSATTSVTVDLRITGPQDTGFGLDSFDSVEAVIGGSGADTLHGNDEGNLLNGWIDPSRVGGNNDALYGHGGDDVLNIGFGNHLVDGGEGSDWLQIVGGPQNGTVQVSLFSQDEVQDTGFGSVNLISIENVAGGNYSDRLIGNDLANIILGGSGEDLLAGFGGDDRIYGDSTIGVGANGPMLTLNLVSANNNDIIYGGAGNDTIYGEVGSDAIDGGEGDDVIDGGVEADALIGGLGNDTFYVDTQGDLVFENAGEGTDTVIATSGYYLYANIENLTLASGAGDIFGVGNELDNTITGNEGVNLLLGGAGDDTMYGGGEQDVLYGESGADVLFGGAGIDTLVGGDGNDIVNGGFDADVLYGQDGDDTLIGGNSFHTDIFIAGDGNDVLRGDSGLADFDLMDGGAGDDAYYVDTGDDLTFEEVGGGIDTVYADIGGENNGLYLYGNVENLVLLGTTTFGVGNELNNEVTGNASGNLLLGGAGDDTIDGGAGGDILYGQAGDDTFVFGLNSGADVIADFTVGDDLIDVSAIGFADFAALAMTFSQVGNDGAIDLGNGNFVVLHNVDMSALDAGDFVL